MPFVESLHVSFCPGCYTSEAPSLLVSSKAFTVNLEPWSSRRNFVNAGAKIPAVLIQIMPTVGFLQFFLLSP